MACWLLKSEPESYAFADLERDGTTEWDGVRNPAAAAHLRAMRVGDEALFYHSGKDKAAVGVVRVTREARPDGADDAERARWVSVEVAPVRALAQPVTLAAMKADARLASMAMLRQPRLSVSPVDEAEWRVLTELSDG